ncbi:hypothetical protein EV421DRAFT_1445988 [Armillaria borealis]|uniref:Uncharacterized protein n=1 Tax=Armillaria borealis TaxID=47425 RepID=A0AA39MFR2_9AGAR|nr:hypothetical protein EV421DRAFT_1445988 [Armillaria borealis]
MPKAQAQPDPSLTLRRALAGSGLGLTLCGSLTLQSPAQALKTQPDPTQTSLQVGSDDLPRVSRVASPQARHVRIERRQAGLTYYHRHLPPPNSPTTCHDDDYRDDSFTHLSVRLSVSTLT